MNHRLMRIGVVLIALSGCVVSELPNNNPDSGVACGVPEAPSGSTSFGAVAAYENAAVSSSTDGGARQAILRLQFLDEARSCAATRDGGPGGGLFAFVIGANALTISPGTYGLANAVDGGDYFYGYRASVGGELLPIHEGTLTLETVADCSVEGSLAVTLRTSDGGVSPLTGTFTSTFCRVM